MAERRVTVGTDVGLHARPAAMFVRAATRSPLSVTVAKDGRDAVDAKSILSVLGLDARQGEEIVISADGEGADAVLDELATVVSGGGE
jgi:phosphocarrier protein HPr